MDYLSQKDFDLMDQDIERDGLTVLQALKAEIDAEVKDFKLNIPADMEQNHRFMFIIDSMEKIMTEISNLIEDKYMRMEKEDLIAAYSNGWHDGQFLMWDKVRKLEYEYKGGEDAANEYLTNTYKKA